MRTSVIAGIIFAVASHAAVAQHEYRGPDAGLSDKNKALRDPATAGATGKDPCVEWGLVEPQLKTCREEWANAKSNPAKIAVRDKYESTATSRDKGKDHTTVADPNATSPCDSLGLGAADLTQCRAQWKSATNDPDRQAVVARYRGVSRGDRSLSRKP